MSHADRVVLVSEVAAVVGEVHGLDDAGEACVVLEAAGGGAPLEGDLNHPYFPETGEAAMFETHSNVDWFIDDVFDV